MPELRDDAVVVVCSRPESSRLPGKAFMEFEGLTTIDHILMRLKDSGLRVVIAIPEGRAELYMRFLRSYPDFVHLFEGDPESPLHRMAQYLEQDNPPKWVVRVTHDDPLVDSKTMLDLLDACESADAGYGYTPNIVEGAGVEVIRSANLAQAAKTRKEPTEFVSYFVKGIEPFSNIVTIQPRKEIRRAYRLTLDYPEDALVLKVVLRALGQTPSLENVCRYLDDKPHILNINRQPDVTFYTCAKDMEKWVAGTMLSVLGTQVPNFEYIVVDDGSADGTLGEMASFATNPNLVLMVNEQNIGLASSSNRALDAARGKAIVRVDADDALLAGPFRDEWFGLLSKIRAGKSIIYPAYRLVDEDGEELDGHVDPRKHHHAGGAVMSRAFLNELRFREGLRHWDGAELFKRASQYGGIDYLDTPIWQYRRMAKSMSTPSLERTKARLEAGL